MNDIRILFLLFIIYSILGWALEVINTYILSKKWIDRGFLIGPYCPIYGFGSILITFFVAKTNDLLATFLKAVFICSILEYATSYIMEKLFKTRWWDYSNDKYNINGRICLRTMVLFGIGGVGVVEFISPNLLIVLKLIPDIYLNILSIIILILFITDLIVSYNIISSFKKIPRNIRKDSTEEITKMVRQTLSNKSYLYKRVVNSFPNFESLIKKYDKKIDKQKRKIKKEKAKLKKMLNK